MNNADSLDGGFVYANARVPAAHLGDAAPLGVQLRQHLVPLVVYQLRW